MNLTQKIQKDLALGRIEAGVKINISELKEVYKVGLTPLREALSELGAKGLLIKEVNKGYYAPKLCPKEAQELYQVASSLELLGLEQSILNYDEKMEARIFHAYHKLKNIERSDVKKSFEMWGQANTEFHRSLISNASAVVHEFLALVLIRAEKYVHCAYQDLKDFQTHHKQHKQLLDAVLAKDIKRAKKISLAHSNEGMKLLLKKLRSFLK